MKVEKDYEDFIRLLNSQSVEYLLVGAYAVAYYAEPRNTGDIDFLINPTKKNAKKVLAVLKKFGFEKLDISENDLLNPDLVIQLGFPPVRIDLLTSLGTAQFKDLFIKKSMIRMGKENTNVISYEHLITSKKAAGRPKDKSDLAALKRSRGIHSKAVK
ncbi:MAG: nucleotidyltransferase [Bacteroidota bacterium]